MAYYLSGQGFEQTLDVFLKEANLVSCEGGNERQKFEFHSHRSRWRTAIRNTPGFWRRNGRQSCGCRRR